MITRLLILLVSFAFFSPIMQGATTTLQNDINVRDISIGSSNWSNTVLEEFIGPLSEFFYQKGSTGKDGLIEAFTVIAFQIKNVMIILAVIFLVIAIIKLLFSPNDEENVKKWRNSIIWVSVGIFVMQIAFSAWSALLIRDVTWGIDSRLGWAIWLQIFAPIVWVLQMLASFAFLAMVIYAFFTIVTGAGDEEKLKKWRKTIIYGLIGFFLMKLPQVLINSLYGTPNCRESNILTIGSCELANQNITGVVGIIGKIITYVNGFLMLACVLLVIYAGWLVLISAGDEEKLKKAKSTILYVLIGFIVLVASHAIFRFFILQG
jgi:hypothetical protein